MNEKLSEKLDALKLPYQAERAARLEIDLAAALKAIVDIEGFSEENWDDETRRQVHIARMKFDGPYAAQNPPRCKVTGNPCGTDTWASGQSCDCDNCQAYLANPNGGNPND